MKVLFGVFILSAAISSAAIVLLSTTPWCFPVA